VIKGDLEKIRDSFRKFGDDELLRAVDVSKKSPLHHAAREGRTSVADYLITKGFKVNARERTLKTPLHYACLFGHAVLAGTIYLTGDLLLKKGADIVAKDCSGRTCFHFACCSWSSETIALVLGLKPELINLGDNIGRTGIHYAVWNSCDSQVDILRTITERGGKINQTDDYGKTALHYAAEGGRARAIPILIQKGADMSIRETRTHKTPLELACDERTRELMIVYSSSPYSLKSKGMAVCHH
jgi:ankyrin repeat protein